MITTGLIIAVTRNGTGIIGAITTEIIMLVIITEIGNITEEEDVVVGDVRPVKK